MTPEDIERHVIGRFKDGAVLCDVLNAAGVPYYTIVKNGAELYSARHDPNEPQSIIDYCCDLHDTTYTQKEN